MSGCVHDVGDMTDLACAAYDRPDPEFDRRCERFMRSDSGRAFLALIKAPGVVGIVKDMASEPGRHKVAAQ